MSKPKRNEYMPLDKLGTLRRVRLIRIIIARKWAKGAEQSPKDCVEALPLHAAFRTFSLFSN